MPQYVFAFPSFVSSLHSASAQEWQFQYYCRIYNLSNFPSANGSLIPIDDPRTDPSNPSCLSNRSGNAVAWQYTGVPPSLRASLTIRSDALAVGLTHQFMVIMRKQHHIFTRSVGYVLARVQAANVSTISVG